ncbi:S1/P1 nuclease-domain-containing protein [Lactifluus subvellereus]|nr:S1/P1 nuclease-domain-containing protein [Lactifluus subvellereus]
MCHFLNLAAVAGLGSLHRALAWGAAGHEIVATIAQSHLDPQVLNTVCSILASDSATGVDQVRADPPCYLSTVATWADKIRFHARWSAPLHYIGGVGDHPPDDCRFPGADGWEGNERGNVLDAIQNVSSILVDFARTSASSGASAAGAPELVQEALKFLIHFAGDMHQPLHLSGRDRGGNSDKVTFDGRTTNLHSVWDNNLIAKALRMTPHNYTHPLPVPALEDSLRGAIYDSYIRRIVWEGVGVGKGTGRWETELDSWLSCGAGPKFVLAQEFSQEVLTGGRPRKGHGPPETSDTDTICPYAWAAPVHALNCDIVWPPELASVSAEALKGPRGDYPELDTPKYTGRIEKEWVVEKLLAMAGVRLAGILHDIFVPQLQL